MSLAAGLLLVGAAALLRYDLRPGDHLVYRETLERRVRARAAESESVFAWDAHVLAFEPQAGATSVGIQRNRTRGELLRYRQDGRDRLEQERATFAEALARRGTAFVETGWVTPQGLPLLPWSAVREASSERLPFFHEIEPLPVQPLEPGARFDSPGLLGLPSRVVSSETVAGEECLRIDSEGSGTRVRHWHCPSSGTLGRLELEAEYDAPGGVQVSERYAMERVSVSRGESAAVWLASPDTVQGALAALAAHERFPLAPEALHRVLDGATPEVARLALAVLWRHRLPPPPLATLSPLVTSPSPRVRVLVARLLGQLAEPEARTLRETLRADPDPFVSTAAAVVPSPSPELEPLARAVRGSGPLPSWAGPVVAGFGRAALRAQRASGQVAGTTLRLMRTGEHRGRPYVLHVPEDYRGDEPYPLVVVLGGGPGRAIPTAQVARASIEPRGELVVFPQANGMWWDEQPAAALDALLRELLAELNVDSDRVTLTGFSNGGTGSLFHAARAPHRYAAVASLMGGGKPFFEATMPIDVAAVARLPWLFVHGAKDEIIPAFSSERTVRALRKANPQGTFELHVIPDWGHEVRYGHDQDRTFPFLARHVREAFPREVALRARSLEHGRAYWVEVLEKGGFEAHVDARVSGQEIALRTRSVKKLRLLLRPELVDLSRPVRVTVDGREALSGRVAVDPAALLRSWRETGDPQLAHAAEIVLDVR